MTLFIVVIALALLIVAFVMFRLDYVFKRTLQFQRRRIQSSWSSIRFPTLGEARKKKQKVPMTDVRDLLVSLQLGTSMQSTLSGSLTRAAEQFAKRGVLGERLRKHVEARLSISPESVLEGLVEDLDSLHLVRVLERIRMAASGGVSYHRVLSVSVEEIDQDIRVQIERNILKAPNQLTVPMIGGVFLPALAAGLIPIMTMVIRQMQLVD
jgi:hypothetical protein